MSRALARIKHDEVARLIKAAQSCGLGVSRISFDGAKVDVIIGDIEVSPPPKIEMPDDDVPLAEPKL